MCLALWWRKQLHRVASSVLNQRLITKVYELARVCYKLLEIPKKSRNFSVAQKLLQKKSKVAFCNKSCPKVAKKKQKHFLFLSSFIWSDVKICNLHNNSDISKHLCATLRCNQRRRINSFTVCMSKQYASKSIFLMFLKL